MDMVTSTLGDYASFAFSLEVKIGSTDSTISLCANQKKKQGVITQGIMKRIIISIMWRMKLRNFFLA